MATPFSASIEDCVRLACLLEATARKPGNVHPDAAFEDLCYRDFVISAETIAPILARTPEIGIGQAIFDAVSDTRRRVGRNTNLGIILLLAPLCAVPAEVPLKTGVGRVLHRLTHDDARQVYRAIRLAHPGGMGTVPQEDISEEPQGTLLDVMRLAAERDRVAAQYANGFQTILDDGVPVLRNCQDFARQWEQVVIYLQLHLMARYPDTLIARKQGADEAQESALRARQVLAAGWPDYEQGRLRLDQFDRWLREKLHRRNPGTTADLITACLFAAFREGDLKPPNERELRA